MTRSRKKWLEGDLLVQKVKGVTAEAQFLEHLSLKAKEMADDLVNAEAIALFDNHDMGGNKPEQIGRNRESLRLLADLINRGAEIHPALMAPEQAANVFPNYEALDTISSKTPLLNDVSDIGSKEGK